MTGWSGDLIPNSLLHLDVYLRPSALLYPQLSELLNIHVEIASK